MQKVVEFLEKHVQWLALGLGLVWLLLMVWGYVIQPPAAVMIGSVELTAGEVDQYAVEEGARPLEIEMKPKDPPPWEVDKFAERWLARMDWQGVEPIRTAGLIHSNPALLEQMFERPGVKQPIPQGPGPVPGPDGGRQLAQGVPQLTVPPAPSDWRLGRSTAIQPPPALAPGAFPVAQGLPQEVDKDWVTQSFKLKLSDIDAAFKKAGIPANPPQQQPIFTTAFLRVEMVREELVDGKWTNPVTIQPLNTGTLREKFPEPKASVHVQQAYYNWAVQQTGDIVQPMFYQTVLNKGDMWERPGEPVQPVMGPGGFNAQQFLVGPIPPNVTPEQRKMIMEARRANAKVKAEQQRQQNRGRARPGRGQAPEMEDVMEAPIDAERPKFLQVQPRNPRTYRPGAGLAPEMEEDPTMMEGMEGEFEQPVQQLMGVGMPDVDYPAGAFDPAQWVALGQPVVQPGAPGPENPRKDEITFWAHDDTVKPGATYRYKARYFIKNPLFQQVAAVKNPAAAREFAIASPFSEWGPQITAPPLTNFFIAGVQPQRQQVRFDVYTWKQGLNHHSVVTVHAGDVVAARTPTAEFQTGHVVVDVREDLRTRNPVVYLADAEGHTVVRTQRGDQDSPVYKKLKEVVAAQQQQQQAAAANGQAVVR